MGALRRGNPFNVGLIFLQGLLWELELLAEAAAGLAAAGLAGELVPGLWCSPAAAPGTAAAALTLFSVGGHHPSPVL